MKLAWLKYFVFVSLFFATTIVASFLYIEFANNQDILEVSDLPKVDAIVIFGAMVYSDEEVSYVLSERLNTGIAAYKQGKATKIIVSGDHGTTQYDEVTAMKNYLLKNGIPRRDIFLDHARFSTYDSIYRIKEVFEVNSAILVTQELHLKRALFIAKCLNLNVKGAVAIPYQGEIFSQTIREFGARFKAVCQAAIFKLKPTFLGEKIPIFSSDGIVTE